MEIGSEFWIEQEPLSLLTERDGIYALSGRTTIDLILQDILKKRQVKSVYMPAWCCDSMLAPFQSRGVDVMLYDISFDGELHYYVDESKTPDIFYVTNYFGYENTISSEIIEHFKSKGAIILYDRTHSMLMDDEVAADYTFASIRKWMAVVTGAMVKGIDSKALKEASYVDIKAAAMKAKYQYLQGDTSIHKEDFLEAFGTFGHHLTEDYRDYQMDALSYTLYRQTDLDSIRQQRRSNASILQENLKLNFIGTLTEKAAPLFVPVFFDTKEDRDTVRKRLIDNQIYCPVHWPKNNLVAPDMKVNHIFDTELSLICDQRYGKPDMERIINLLSI